MSSQAVCRHHANPSVNRRSAVAQCLAKSADLPQGLLMVEHQKVLGKRPVVIPFDFIQSSLNLLDTGRLKAWPEQDGAQWIDITAGSLPAKKDRFKQRGPPPHERIVDKISRLGEPLDEEAWQLRLEAGAVRYLVQRARSSLFGRPKLVREKRNCFPRTDILVAHQR
jgi:hypothetical protein